MSKRVTPLPNQNSFRVTQSLLAVLDCILAVQPKAVTGADICRETKMPSGTVYPLLSRLHAKDWLSMEEEDIDPKIEGRPKRKFYRFTDGGLEEGRSVLLRAGGGYFQNKSSVIPAPVPDPAGAVAG